MLPSGDKSRTEDVKKSLALLQGQQPSGTEGQDSKNFQKATSQIGTTTVISGFNIDGKNLRDVPSVPRNEPTPCVKCSLPKIVLPPQEYGQVPVQKGIEYMPYEKVVVEQQMIEKKELVPKEVWVTEYQTVKRMGKRAVERVITDYYEVQYITEYIEQPVQETRIQMVEQQIIQSQATFLPVERSIVHYPLDATSQSYQYMQQIIDKNAVSETREPDHIQKSIFYDPSVQKIMPTLYGLVNVSTAVGFDGENRDSVLIQNLNDGSVMQTSQSNLSTNSLNPAVPNQRYKLMNKGEGYAFYNPATKTCLEVKQANPETGNQVVPSKTNNFPGQNWYLDIVDGTVAKIRAVSAPQLLISKDKKMNKLRLMQDMDDRSQMWNIIGLQLLGS